VRKTWDEVAGCEPDVLFIACCGQPAERARRDWAEASKRPEVRRLPAVRSGRVYFADGNAYFSRPGPRLVDSLEILAHALHPDLCPLPDGLPAPGRIQNAERSPAVQGSLP
jgi:iron complex transport system substrate-binding protein